MTNLLSMNTDCVGISQWENFKLLHILKLRVVCNVYYGLAWLLTMGIFFKQLHVLKPEFDCQMHYSFVQQLGFR